MTAAAAPTSPAALLAVSMTCDALGMDGALMPLVSIDGTLKPPPPPIAPKPAPQPPQPIAKKAAATHSRKAAAAASTSRKAAAAAATCRKAAAAAATSRKAAAAATGNSMVYFLILQFAMFIIVMLMNSILMSC